MSKQSLGRLVQRTRQSRGLSQYALSKAAGITMPYVQRLENGEYDTFPEQYLENVAQVLGLSMDALAAELEKPDRPAGGVSLHVTGKADGTEEEPAPALAPPEEAPSLATAEPPVAPARRGAGPVDITGSGQSLLSLVPPINPERLMADIALLSDEDQQRVATFVQELLKGTKQNK